MSAPLVTGQVFLEAMAKVAAPDVEARGLVGFLHSRARFGATIERVPISEIDMSITPGRIDSPSLVMGATAAISAQAIDMPAYQMTWPDSWESEKPSVYSIFSVPKDAFHNHIVSGEVTLYARSITLREHPEVDSHQFLFYGERDECNPIILGLSGCMRLPEARYLFGHEGVSEEETMEVMQDAFLGAGLRQLSLARARKIVYGHEVGARLLDALLRGDLTKIVGEYDPVSVMRNGQVFSSCLGAVLKRLKKQIGSPCSEIEDRGRRGIVDKIIQSLCVPLEERAEQFRNSRHRRLPDPGLHLQES